MQDANFSRDFNSTSQTERAQEELMAKRMRLPSSPLVTSPPKFSDRFSVDDRLILKHGDTLTFLGTIPSKSIKLIISSPPYNLGKQYETRIELQSYLKNQQPVIDELIRVLKDDGNLCWEVGNYVCNGEVFPLDIFYYDFFKEHGLKLRNRIVGTSSTGSTPQSVSRDVTRLCFGLPREIATHLTWTV